MNDIRIMLCCGAGMSSGILAQRARKIAKTRGLNVVVEARSESDVHNYFQNMDILFIGPHFASHQEQLAKMAEPYNIPVLVISKEIYSTLDGEKLLEIAFSTLEIK